jgi:dipeptidyl-peptidase 4
MNMFKTEGFTKNGTGLKLFPVMLLILFLSLIASSQTGNIKWSNDGNSYYRLEKNEIIEYTLPGNKPVVIISKEQLTLKDKLLQFFC